MKGKLKLSKKDFILQETDGGKTFYELQIQQLEPNGEDVFKNVSSPFRNDDTPSFSIYLSYDSKRWRFKDFGGEGLIGDVFDFASIIYGYDLKKDFPKILDRMIEELDLKYEDSLQEKDHSFNLGRLKRVKQHLKKTIEFNNGNTAIFREFDDWSRIEYFFLKDYHIKPIFLQYLNVYIIERYTGITRNGKSFYHNRKSDEVILLYYFGTYGKIYHAKPKKSFLHIGKKTGDYFFGVNKHIIQTIKDKERREGIKLIRNFHFIIITGGEKDVLTLLSHEILACCFNSENEFPSHLIHNLVDNFEYVISLFDNDDTGIKASNKLKKEYEIPYITLPNKLKEKGGKDISDWALLNFDFEEIHQQIKQIITPKSPISAKSAFLQKHDSPRLEGFKNKFLNSKSDDHE